MPHMADNYNTLGLVVMDAARNWDPVLTFSLSTSRVHVRRLE